jgi:pectate lyase
MGTLVGFFLYPFNKYSSMEFISKIRKARLNSLTLLCILLNTTNCEDQDITSTPGSTPPVSIAEIPAFPGAFGHGSLTPGGRGGEIIKVTSLADDGPGTFRQAVQVKAPRIIIFEVGGTISLESPVFIDEPFVTIAGQTAPGDGIMFRDGEVCIRTHDVIMRGIRIRVGDANQVKDWDGLALEATPLSDVYNVIVDHCSVSWGIDENIGTDGSRGQVSHVTFSWNITSEALYNSHHGKGTHSKGMLLSKNNVTNISVHHNLFAHNDDRNPKIAQDVNVELINNVIYNYRSGSRMDPGSKADIIGNYYKAGPNTNIGQDGEINKGIVMGPVEGFPPMLAYVLDNVGPGRLTNSGDDWLAVRGSEEFRSLESVVEASGIPEDDVSGIFEKVLADVGATVPQRDAVDRRVIEDVRNGNGAIIDSQEEVGGWPAMKIGEAKSDRDGDGIPDTWEIDNELDPDNSGDAHGDIDNDGYSNIEEYLNDLFDEN